MLIKGAEKCFMGKGGVITVIAAAVVVGALTMHGYFFAGLIFASGSFRRAWCVGL